MQRSASPIRRWDWDFSHVAHGRWSMSLPARCTFRGCSGHFASREPLWYFPMMQPEALSPRPATAWPTASPQRSLAAIHADALYRPVPPVARDDEGYPHDDGAPAGERLPRPAAGLPRLNHAHPLPERTWHLDLAVKPALYQDLGVGEFWILDVIGKLPAPVIGMRLNPDGVYEPVPPSPGGALASEVLGCELLDNDRNFRFRDLATGKLIPDYAESEQMREAAEADANVPRKRIAELEEQLRKPATFSVVGVYNSRTTGMPRVALPRLLNGR